LPDYTRIKTERLYEKVVEQIEASIFSGRLRAGDRLPSERELAGEFGVSRTAIREAVKALSEKGLVEAYPGRGTFITDATPRAMRHSLGRMMRIGQAEGVRHLVEMRELLEPEIAALAAARVTGEQIAAMQDAVAIMDGSVDNPEVFVEADLDFHLALAEATQNTLIPILIDSVVDLLREHRKRISRVPGGGERAQYHHKRILEAVTRRDLEAARAAMHAHLRQIREDSEASVHMPG
jgi:GntR family transcriptional repressor for pyruvate dehydrogenase complex